MTRRRRAGGTPAAAQDSQIEFSLSPSSQGPAQAVPPRVTGGPCDAVVRVWHAEKGWGVLDCEQTPGGCWAHFSAVEMTGFRALAAGQRVRLDWESARQDGHQFRATKVLPE